MDRVLTEVQRNLGSKHCGALTHKEVRILQTLPSLRLLVGAACAPERLLPEGRVLEAWQSACLLARSARDCTRPRPRAPVGLGGVLTTCGLARLRTTRADDVQAGDHGGLRNRAAWTGSVPQGDELVQRPGRQRILQIFTYQCWRERDHYAAARARSGSADAVRSTSPTNARHRLRAQSLAGTGPDRGAGA